MTVVLDDKSFRSFVATNRAAFVHFWAAWNGYDMPMRAIIARVEPSYRDRIAFGTLDVDPAPHQALCLEHNVAGPPYYAYYRDGVLIKTEVGILTEIELRHRLDELLK